jgi:hypothetical protein
MKLSIAFLVLGVIFVAVGLGLRQYGVSQHLIAFNNTMLIQSIQKESVGIGLLALGSGLFISGIVIVILKRKSKDKS